MIIVQVIGGLGNQMFQYAFAYSLSRYRNCKFKLDISEFKNYEQREYALDQFGIQAEIASAEEIKKLKYLPDPLMFSRLKRFLGKPIPMAKSYYKEPHFNFDSSVFSKKSSYGYYEGYWQTDKYFKNFRGDILKLFNPIMPISKYADRYLGLIEHRESISLHVRRGDYVTNSTTNNYHGTCSLDYYSRACQYICEEVPNAHFFVFSDDLQWAKENLTFLNSATYVEFSENVPDSEEIYLMSRCKHNIIANSSFSWWGAWLNTNAKKIVIAPKQWFRDAPLNTVDLLPNEWLKV